MANVTSTPALADLYRLGEQLERDKSASVRDLRRRDHEIGLQCDAPDDPARLLFWLSRVPHDHNLSGQGGESWLSESSAAFVARCLAAVSGFAGMATFLVASGEGLVNVFLFLLLFVLVQLVLCCFSAFVMVSALRGSPPVVLPVNPARFVIARVFPDKRYLRECQSVVRLLLLRYGQEIGAIFTLGAVAAFFLVLAFSDTTFVWGSTFNVSDDFVRDFTHVLAAPWSSWLPVATLPAELITDSRYHPALTDLNSVNVSSLRGWWPFLIMAVLCYALFPRIILWVLSKVFYVRMMRRSLVQYPGSEGVLARMSAPVVSTQAQEPEESGLAPGEGVSIDDNLMLLNWAGALDKEHPGAYRQTGAVAADNVLEAGLGSLADDDQTQDKIERYRPECLLVAVKSWEPPMAELGDFLSKLEQVRRCALCLVPLPRRTVADLRLQEWREFSRALPFDVVDVQELTIL